MTPAPLPTSDALVGVVSGWWAPDGVHRQTEPAHRMARSGFTGRRGKKTLCGQTLIHVSQVLDGSTAREACEPCATAAARLPSHDDPVHALRFPPPSRPRSAHRGTAAVPNTAASRTARRAAFRNSWMPSARVLDYDVAPYDPPSSSLFAATAVTFPS